MTNRYLQFRPASRVLSGIFAILLLAAAATAQDSEPWSINRSPLPAPTGFVNDYAGVLDAATKQQLETKLRELKETTSPSVEIAVAVVRTTGERAISEYSIAVARGWGIGSKEDDNPSALLFVAIDDRKYFTQISKDLEDELPDGVVGNLQRQFLVPEFRKGNYAKGISDTIDAYIYTVKNKGGTATPTPRSLPRGTETTAGVPIFGVLCCGLILIIVLMSIFGSRNKRSASDRDRWGGGGFGGGGGIGGSALPWIVGGILSGGSSSGSSDWGGSSGGSDWGGFGGGGDFGGGGAGGDW